MNPMKALGGAAVPGSAMNSMIFGKKMKPGQAAPNSAEQGYTAATPDRAGSLYGA